MGHLRLGYLPKSLKWNKLVGLLEDNPIDSKAIANATLSASKRELDRLQSDRSIGYCFWLLTRITWYARQQDFLYRLQDLGIHISSDDNAFIFISSVSDHARKICSTFSGEGIFREMAYNALRQTLSETTIASASSLFDASIISIQEACKIYSSRKQFGNLSRLYFSIFLIRFLRYFIDKELSDHIGPDNKISTVGEVNDFNSALNTYAWQSSKIMEEFASGWYGKKNWENEGDITVEDAQKFVAIALRKLHMEVGREEVQ